MSLLLTQPLLTCSLLLLPLYLQLGGGRLLLQGGERDAGALDDVWTLRGLDGTEQLRWGHVRFVGSG